jgi:hypothetical protein
MPWGDGKAAHISAEVAQAFPIAAPGVAELHEQMQYPPAGRGQIRLFLLDPPGQ